MTTLQSYIWPLGNRQLCSHVDESTDPWKCSPLSSVVTSCFSRSLSHLKTLFADVGQLPVPVNVNPVGIMSNPWNDSLIAPFHLSEWWIPPQFSHEKKNLQGILTTLFKSILSLLTTSSKKKKKQNNLKVENNCIMLLLLLQKRGTMFIIIIFVLIK